MEEDDTATEMDGDKDNKEEEEEEEEAIADAEEVEQEKSFDGKWDFNCCICLDVIMCSKEKRNESSDKCQGITVQVIESFL